MTKFIPKNLKLVGEGYLSKVCYKKRLFYPLPPPGSLIIGGSRVEHDTPRNGPVAAGRIDFWCGLKCGDYGGKIAKNSDLKKVRQLFLIGSN